MSDFFKEHSFNMVKLFLNQIVMSVFGIMLWMAVLANKPVLLAASIFSVLFYLFINYSALWELGAKDKIRVDAGRLAAMPQKGIYIALGAAVPNVILTLLIGIGVVIDTAASQSVGTICNVIVRLINGMYLGIIDCTKAAVFEGTPLLSDIWWWYFIINIPALFVGWLAYFLGSKNIRIGAFFGIKQKANTGTKKH